MSADTGCLEVDLANDWGLGLRPPRTGGRQRVNFLASIFALALISAMAFPGLANAESPGVTTEAAGEVTPVTATLHGKVNPHGFATTYRFEYGTTTSYGTNIPVPDKSAGSGSSGVEVSETSKGLKPGTTYHFRLASFSAEGSSYGKDVTYTTEDPRFSTSFGSEGTGNGQFKAPQGIAIDSEGNIWVVDTENNRIQKFNSKGEYQGQFGSFGSGNGQFNKPTDIVINYLGSIYVSDTGNNRIQRFNEKGEYLSKFGSEGSGNGQFKKPMGMDHHNGNTLIVADTDNNRIQQFNSEGTYLSQFGTSGSNNGQFKEPMDVVSRPVTGATYVVDAGNARIQQFNYQGEYQAKFGSNGTGDGQFKEPYGITLDKGEKLWITDAGNARVQGFTLKGEYLSQFGAPGSGSGQFDKPRGVESDSAGNIWVIDRGNSRVQKWTPIRPTIVTKAADELTLEKATLHGTVNPNGFETTYHFEYSISTFYGSGTNVPVPDKGIGSGASSIEISEPISGLNAGETYYFWLVATNAEGTSYGKSETFTLKADPRFAFAFGSFGSEDGQFQDPSDVAIDSEGNVWVADGVNNCILKFNSKGEYLSQFGSYGAENGQFFAPYGLAIDSEGNIWVADTANSRIQKFNSKGEYLSKFGSEGGGNGQLYLPYDLAIDSKGNIWVADTTNSRIQKFNSKGEYLSKFGGPYGLGDGELAEPTSLAIDSEGNIWVADTGNNRIQKFNSKGEYLFKFGTYGQGNGQLSVPWGIAIGNAGDLWIADPGNSRVQHFSSEGEYLSKFGSEGDGNGQFYYDDRIAIDLEGNLWIADEGNIRVQKWIPNRPATTTEAASKLTKETATLNATVNPNGLETEYRFEYGTTTTYGTSVPVPDKSAGSGSSGVEVSEGISGLKASTTYHFRVVATNAEGTSFGKDETFTTK
jgi:streptogramin lyase